MDTATGSAGIVALVAGALVGALVRALLARGLSTRTGRVVWLWESGLGLVLGAVLAVPALSAMRNDLTLSGLGGAMTAYCGACAAYGYVGARAAGAHPVSLMALRLLSASAATTAGFVGVVALTAAIR